MASDSNCKKVKVFRYRNQKGKLEYENWYPNFSGNKVKVSLHICKKDRDFYVCIWGNDVFGMESYCRTREEAEGVFL